MGETRRSHKKTRTGCTQCKRRRVKCDEGKPSCANCTKNKIQCSLDFLTPMTSSSRSLIIASSTSSYSPSLTPELSPSTFSPQTNELLHHYSTTLYLSLADNRTPRVWKVGMLQMGLEYPFLLSGIQAVSALHLASLLPNRKDEFYSLALSRESAALPSFRATLINPKPETIDAIFAFAGSIVYYVMASPEHFAGEKIDRCRIPTKNDDHPHWFQTMRGLMGLLMNHWNELLKGQFHDLLDSLPPGSDLAIDPPEDEHFGKLEGLFPNSTDDRKVEICREALKELRDTSAFSNESSGIRSIKSSIHMWAGRVSQEYMELVYERDPRALVILAHFCVLLKRNNHHWYSKGLGTGMLDNVRHALGEEWQPWIQWALDQPVSETEVEIIDT
ncbi:uncharacterized protein LY89DRAFT_603329 [Mollisia scopiformis]|uniref:Zn(2)-C6 fungal-type domain-containing protein n=1 Tax=Mollisia scopiformis TaxID=149040 RepID=A0A132B214_MOLSC|nr:uncharacterized protein LY89DRAFT_603329 [Mollisia scopiformis]KUJ06426.1 hypothetical protein LY89DRAFT_603329 [Mollisia scopiformis]